jgi:lipopolysaccharide export system permease protein
VTRIDLFLSIRILLVIIGVIVVAFTLIYLSETINVHRFERISRTLGEDAANLASLIEAAVTVIKTLPVMVLIGAILALIDLQAHRELLIMKAAGISIWRLVRGPIVVVILLALAAVFVADAALVPIKREINPTTPGDFGAGRSNSLVWLAQTGADGDFILSASSASPDGSRLLEVTAFRPDDPLVDRFIASAATYANREWVLTGVLVRSPVAKTRILDEVRMPTNSTIADLRLELGSAADLTLTEVYDLIKRGITDPNVLAAAQTRFLRLAAFPAVLVGVLLIAFGFTSGYHRTNSFGRGIGYGTILGLVVFVISEMADRAGSSGVLDPALAAWGPAFAAIIIGLTILLHREDGRA